MEERTVRQVQGAVELLRDVTRGAAGEIGAAHAEIAALPYAVLRRVPLLGAPAGAIEQMQAGITRLVYESVGAIAGVAAAGATRLLRLVAEVQEKP